MVKAKLQSDGTLSDEQILDIISDHDTTMYDENERYFKGDNPTITDQAEKEDDIPDNRVKVPYARKIALTTQNYLFSRDVQYESQDDEYLSDLQNVHYINDHETKVSDIGHNMIVHGASYLLFYTDKVDGAIYPRYAVIDNDEIIAVYDYSIEPKLVAAIRYYDTEDEYETTVKMVEVYYEKNEYFYDRTGGTLALTKKRPHGFSGVPLVKYGDDYEIGVFDPVKSIIDAIDTITSTNMNEIQRFELAYLVLTGQSIEAEDLDETEKKGLFELDKDAQLAYLTKEINYNFHGSVLDFLVAQVHKQSGVPDFDAKEFAAESGIALQYKLMGFENLSAAIENEFKSGEYRAIDLINSILYRNNSFLSKFMFFKKNRTRRVKITMSRNLPEDIKAKMEIALQMQSAGVSKKTLFSYMPMIENAEDEIKKSEKESEENFNKFFQQQQNTEKQVDDNQDMTVQ